MNAIKNMPPSLFGSTLPPVMARTAAIGTFATTGPDAPIRATLSSETPGKRWWGDEILSHSVGAIDWSGLRDGGLPLTLNHSEKPYDARALPIGRVAGVELRDGTLVGSLEFDGEDELARTVRGKLERGLLTDLSITYEPLESRFDEDRDAVVHDSWRPRAVSLVTAGMDVTATVNRSLEGMLEFLELYDVNGNPRNADRQPTGDQAVTDRTYQDGRREARESVAAILNRGAELGRMFPVIADELDALARRTSADEDGTLDRFNHRALELVASADGEGGPASAGPADRSAPIQTDVGLPGGQRRTIVSGGASELERSFRGMELALQERVCTTKPSDEDMRGNTFRGYRLVDICEYFLRQRGVDTRGMAPIDIATAEHRRAIDPGTGQYTTASFPALTANLATKRLFEGFDAADRTWDIWSSDGGVPDFRQFSVPRISLTTLLPAVVENAQYQNLERGDAGELATLVKYGGVISFTMEAILNNDVNGFSDQAASCGEAAQATVDTNVYAKLLANDNMGDGFPLFDAINHSNTGTAALDDAGLTATRVAMGRQTDDAPTPRSLGVRMRYILVPLELETTAKRLAEAEFLKDSGGEWNPHQNTFMPISTHQLTDGTDWYGLAARGKTFRVFFLDGQRAPSVEQEEGWRVDAIHWKVRHPHVVVPQDWRGLYRNVVAGA